MFLWLHIVWRWCGVGSICFGNIDLGAWSSWHWFHLGSIVSRDDDSSAVLTLANGRPVRPQLSHSVNQSEHHRHDEQEQEEASDASPGCSLCL